ncbi:MAG TPA: mechanosensitive ion channel family protein [Chitinophagales bacterium]|nr:mechanosensitive ion channel family protein [Chitinophagales bacterium]HRK26111.1 mechanosensitive ion channel family protein [Chitinophagales bacterium]
MKQLRHKVSYTPTAPLNRILPANVLLTPQIKIMLTPLLYIADFFSDTTYRAWLKEVNRFIVKKHFLEMPWLLLYIFIIWITTVLLARLFDKLFNQIINSSVKKLQNDPTNYVFLKHFGRAMIYIFGFSIAVWSIPELRAISKSLLAGAGILAVVVGFASQAALANIVSGLFIVIFRPFSVKDHLTIDDTTFGVVEDITLRHTVLRNQENRRIVVPNSIINSKVILNSNLNDLKICKFIEINVAYDTDLDKAIAVMQEEVFNHPYCIDNRKQEDKQAGKHPVMVKVVRLDDYFIRLRAWAWAADNSHAYEMTLDLNKRLVERFREEGIHIPFPIQTLLINPSGASNNAPAQNL